MVVTVENAEVVSFEVSGEIISCEYDGDNEAVIFYEGEISSETEDGGDVTYIVTPDGVKHAITATTAETAEKLGSRSIGTNTAPVYLSSGSPVACSMATGF
ncbi:MAG: hypothetical protein LIO87_05860 [Eubacterium sp.]|nr:hypothetical protein [Eubacterium sp.]